MSDTKDVPCPDCDGTGEIDVWDYSAQDVSHGSNEVPEHTMKVRVTCRQCLGQGHVRVNKDQQGLDTNRS